MNLKEIQDRCRKIWRKEREDKLCIYIIKWHICEFPYPVKSYQNHLNIIATNGPT